MVRQDKKENVTRGESNKHLIPFVKASCDVSFDVWETRDSDGKSLGKFEWTSVVI